MLARKDKNNSIDSHLLDRKKSTEPSVHGECEERHLEELLGYLDVMITFGPDMSVIEEPVVIKIPACKIVTLTPREQIPFETILAKQLYLKKRFALEKIEKFYDEIKELKNITYDEKKLNELSIDLTRNYLNKFEEINLNEYLQLDKLDENEDSDFIEVIFNVFFVFFKS